MYFLEQVFSSMVLKLGCLLALSVLLFVCNPSPYCLGGEWKLFVSLLQVVCVIELHYL